MEKLPTLEEYNEAKELVIKYEAEVKRLKDINVSKLKADVTKFLSENAVNGIFINDKFYLYESFGTHYIVPTHHLEELENTYSGDLDEALQKIGHVYGYKLRFVLDMYNN